MTDKDAGRFKSDYENFYKGLQGGLSCLLYLQVGDSVLTSFGEFYKASDDLIHLKNIQNPEDVVDGLGKQRILRTIL